MAQNIYEIKNEFKYLDTASIPNRGKIPMVVYQPVEKTERNQIAVLAMHNSAKFLGFEPIVELAKRGYIAAGADPIPTYDIRRHMLDVKAAVDYLKHYTGVKKVVLLGHSGGAALLGGYQYMAENGISRFKNTKRIIPFPDIETLTPADGLMLADANYNVMTVFKMDPAIKNLDNVYDRAPELDLYNPENGYAPGDAHYPEEFARKFQKAQVKFYKDMLARAQERYELIKAGKGRFNDDEPFFIPGAGGGGGGYGADKFFTQDNRYLNHTSVPRPHLKNGGKIVEEIVHTVRPMWDAVKPNVLAGFMSTSVLAFLSGELKLDDDFGYDATSIWGTDWNFNPSSARENVKGISVPLLCEGNTGGHEFLEAEFSYVNAKSQDKTIVFLEGAAHSFHSVKPEYGDTLATFADYAADWLAKPGRFLH